MAADSALAFLAELAAIKKEHCKNLEEWDELSAFPKKAKFGNVITINGNQIVYVTVNKAYLYDSTANKIKPWIEYPDRFRLNFPVAAFDKKLQKLYIVGLEKKRLIIVDIHSKKVETYTKVVVNDRDTRKACMIFAKGSLHLIGGRMNPKHYIWNDDNKKFEPTFDFHPIYGASVVHIPSKDMLLFFGGGNIRQIWQFSFGAKKWTEWGDHIKFAGEYGMSVLTNDEKYVILDGGSRSPKIFILDIDEQCMLNCSITFPERELSLLTKTGDIERDNCLIYGYSRNVKSLEIPVEIINLLVEYYSVEMLHWIQYGSWNSHKQHYQIPVSKILSK